MAVEGRKVGSHLAVAEEVFRNAWAAQQVLGK